MGTRHDRLEPANRELVSELTNNGAVNFEVIGQTLAKFGPRAAMEFDGEDWFCGTMRRFVRVYRLGGDSLDLEDLGRLRDEIGPEIQ